MNPARTRKVTRGPAHQASLRIVSSVPGEEEASGASGRCTVLLAIGFSRSRTLARSPCRPQGLTWCELSRAGSCVVVAWDLRDDIVIGGRIRLALTWRRVALVHALLGGQAHEEATRVRWSCSNRDHARKRRGFLGGGKDDAVGRN